MNVDRVAQVASLLSSEAYEAEFSGKRRGRFIVGRDHLKEMLGVKRLHPPMTEALADACLMHGLVLIDMDDAFAFAETKYVDKWRKLPVRLVQEYVHLLDGQSEEEGASISTDNGDEDDG